MEYFLFETLCYGKYTLSLYACKYNENLDL